LLPKTVLNSGSIPRYSWPWFQIRVGIRRAKLLGIHVTNSSRQKRLTQVVRAAEGHFGNKIRRVTAPGGDGRASYKLHFDDRTVFATLRPNFRRTHLEAHVLKQLAPHCDLVPRCLGVVGEVMFQSDVGGRRLNMEIAARDAGGQADLAAEAVRAIFKVQEASRKTRLHEIMPHLGNNRDWIDNFAEGVRGLEPYSGGRSGPVDLDAIKAAVAQPGRQFVKWDCRSGNAAIGRDDVLRWFDFEYSGLRHGAEDIAWLIGDEAWPVSPEVMLEIVRSEFDPGCGHALDPYLDYLALYLTFHCAQRFKLIVKEAGKRGWLSKRRIRKYDDAGVHPEFGAQICRVGAFFAARNPLTAPIARDFEAAQNMFLSIILATLEEGRA
jgi:hypothetical protein